MKILLVLSIIYTIYAFFQARAKERNMPAWRRKEALRYFNGSVVGKGYVKDDSKFHKTGIALVKEKATGKYVFVKQSKVAGPSIF